jgi:cation diffusion facilitator CzcD-associated flavoprotein CzcO
VRTRPKVVVLGGGFGGLETVFYLRHTRGDRVDLTVARLAEDGRRETCWRLLFLVSPEQPLPARSTR